jgi:hypothetical protein
MNMLKRFNAGIFRQEVDERLTVYPQLADNLIS